MVMSSLEDNQNITGHGRRSKESGGKFRGTGSLEEGTKKSFNEAVRSGQIPEKIL